MSSRLDSSLSYYVKPDPKAVKKRKCLSCSREFDSEHKFNRICSRCKRLDRSTTPFDEENALNVKSGFYF